MPFEPTPPLQPDWQRVLTSHPFDAEPLRRSLTQTPVWTDMGQAYMSSVESWRELPGGDIEFTMRRLPSAD